MDSDSIDHIACDHKYFSKVKKSFYKNCHL